VFSLVGHVDLARGHDDAVIDVRPEDVSNEARSHVGSQIAGVGRTERVVVPDVSVYVDTESAVAAIASHFVSLYGDVEFVRHQFGLKEAIVEIRQRNALEVLGVLRAR